MLPDYFAHCLFCLQIPLRGIFEYLNLNGFHKNDSKESWPSLATFGKQIRRDIRMAV